MPDPNAGSAATVLANCGGSTIPRPFTSHSGKTSHLRDRPCLPEDRGPRRLLGRRSERMGRPRHQNFNERSRRRHSAAGEAARSHSLCRKGAALTHEDTPSRSRTAIQRTRSARAISRRLNFSGSKSASRTVFGLVDPFRRRFSTAIGAFCRSPPAASLRSCVGHPTTSEPSYPVSISCAP